MRVSTPLLSLLCYVSSIYLTSFYLFLYFFLLFLVLLLFFCYLFFSFVIFLYHNRFCLKGAFSCCDTTNPDTEGISREMYGHRLAGIFGYSSTTGGYPGVQAEYARYSSFLLLFYILFFPSFFLSCFFSFFQSPVLYLFILINVKIFCLVGCLSLIWTYWRFLTASLMRKRCSFLTLFALDGTQTNWDAYVTQLGLSFFLYFLFDFVLATCLFIFFPLP